MTSRPLPSQKISKKALSVWRIKGAIEALVYLAFPAALLIFTIRQDWPVWIVSIVLPVIAVFAIWKAWFFPAMTWKRWRYEVYEKEVELRRGVVITKHTLIPMSRIQHVDTAQGPLYKKYGLSALTISTAAGIHEIPALAEEVGQDLRDHISRLAEAEDSLYSRKEADADDE
ncbi:PH domain-containing protein [Sinobaca sp. H24]|uniref:PH domain-containing protein n=1 Tax=Sinobaca sp. H24 TaxID=2923376 RepID=UPI0020792113|nr:PH domain-containing protein [Sinobaca sp. H24]